MCLKIFKCSDIYTSFFHLVIFYKTRRATKIQDEEALTANVACEILSCNFCSGRFPVSPFYIFHWQDACAFTTWNLIDDIVINDIEIFDYYL